MIILVDMDDVLELFINGWIAYNNRKFGLDAKPEDVTCWRMELAYPTLTREQVYAAEKDDALWDLVYPMPGADEALRRMIADGHEVFVVTSTVYETLRAKMEKVLFKYFPYISWDHVIITSHKYLVKGDVLIDDGPHNFEKGDYRKILFNARHNRDFDESTVGAVRVYNWEEAYEQVRKIAEETEK